MTMMEWWRWWQGVFGGASSCSAVADADDGNDCMGGFCSPVTVMSLSLTWWIYVVVVVVVVLPVIPCCCFFSTTTAQKLTNKTLRRRIKALLWETVLSALHFLFFFYYFLLHTEQFVGWFNLDFLSCPLLPSPTHWRLHFIATNDRNSTNTNLPKNAVN